MDFLKPIVFDVQRNPANGFDDIPTEIASTPGHFGRGLIPEARVIAAHRIRHGSPFIRGQKWRSEVIGGERRRIIRGRNRSEVTVILTAAATIADLEAKLPRRIASEMFREFGE